MAKKKLADLQTLVNEYAQRDSGNIVAAQYGVGVSEEDDLTDVNVDERFSRFSLLRNN